MAYKALYRKYRPNTFEEVVGQNSIVSTLLNAAKNDKLAHAYLFCGPRGTGKTTIAKLLAKTINCEAEDNKPCGKCENCIEALEGNHPDIIEMDAATNNGVDEVREIIDRVKYAPMRGKYKVYIIDEVHMMTTSAFNALLKTLEEPPEYCIFILATTEPHKVLPTIISRCQRFDFKKIPSNIIVYRLMEIANKENVDISEDALKLIAELSDGGMRDALSILDQCIAYANGKIEVTDVENVYGVASISEKISILNSVKSKNAKEIANKVNRISENGLDVQRLTIDLINICKECVLYSYSRDKDLLSVINEQNANELLKMFNTSELLAYIDFLMDIQGKYKNANDAITYFEICLLKMMNYQNVPVIQPTYQQTVVKEEAKPLEKIVVKKTKVEPVVEVKEEVVVSNIESNVVELTDDEFYEILISANKTLKEVDKNSINAIPAFNYQGLEKQLLDVVLSSELMASSKTKMIFAVNSRPTANLINNKDNKQLLENIINGYLINKKEIFAVTQEYKNYLITYFKSKQASKPVVEQPVQKVEEQPTEPEEKIQIKKLKQLFGEDGFDVIGDNN